MSALAAATLRSAARMSGRWRSSSDGTETGTDGGFGKFGFFRNAGTGGGGAGQNGQRVDEFHAVLIEPDAVGLGGGDFGLGAREVEPADGAGVAAFGQQVEGLAADFQSAGEHGAIRIHRAQGPVGLRHLAGDAETQRVEHFLGGLFGGGGGFHLAADFSPNVDFVAEIRAAR